MASRVSSRRPAPLPEPQCPNEAEHTPCPDGYVQWWSWCERMNRTHEQRECEGCGKWAIWFPRPAGMLAQCWRCAERVCDPADFGEDEEMLCPKCVAVSAR